MLEGSLFTMVSRCKGVCSDQIDRCTHTPPEEFYGIILCSVVLQKLGPEWWFVQSGFDVLAFRDPHASNAIPHIK